MATLSESAIFEEGIFQLEKSTPALGGAPVFSGSNPTAGHANAQAAQLANRTQWLKAELQNKLPSFSNYSTLRAYAGNAEEVRVLNKDSFGSFYLDTVDTTSPDDGGTVIVTTSGVRYKRAYHGNIKASWFRSGESNDDSASSKAAKAALSWSLDSDGDYPLVPYCPWAIVELPSGVWTLTSEIDTGNREVVWIVPVGCQLIGAQYLNGRIVRNGSKITDFHHGILDSSTGFAVMSNRKLDEVAPVGGIGTASRLSAGNGRDTVGGYFGNMLPGPVYSTASVNGYTATGVSLSTPLSTSQMYRMRRGMIIQTKHSPKYASYVTSWTSTQINVSGGWFLVDRTAVGTATTPSGTDGLDINVFRKAWALNANAFLTTESYGDEIVGAEIGVSNAKAESTGMGGNIATYGGLFVSLKADSNDYYNTYATITGGRWVNGYTSIGGVRTAFTHIGSLGRADELQNLLSGTTSAGVGFFNIDATGNIEAGRRGGGVTSTLIIDGHSSGNTNDYDGRISLSGGTGANGAGIWSITAGQVTMNAAATDFVGVPRPSVDNTYTLGQASRRWTTVYASTGTINTSDENSKMDIVDISDKVLDAWERVNFKSYKFKDSVESKQDKARIHFGVIAQQVKKSFESEGLDPFAYGLLCYDSWEKQEAVVETWEDKYEEVILKAEVLSEEGEVIEPKLSDQKLVRKAGSKILIPETSAGQKYGIRYDEAIILECALMRRTNNRLEDRLRKLEARENATD